MLINFYVKRVIDLVHIITAWSIYGRSWHSTMFLFIQAQSLRKCGYHKIERFVFSWPF